MSSYPQLHAPQESELGHSTESIADSTIALTKICWFVWFTICGLFIFNTGYLLAVGLNQTLSSPPNTMASWFIAILLISMNTVCALCCQLKLELLKKINHHLISTAAIILPGMLLAMECVVNLGFSHSLCVFFITMTTLLLIPYFQSSDIEESTSMTPVVSLKFPAVIDSEIEAEVDESTESDSNPLYWSKTGTTINELGVKEFSIQGGFTIYSLEPGEIVYQHIPFLPAYNTVPRATTFVNQDSSIRAKIAELKPYGMRIEIRSISGLVEPVTFNYEVKPDTLATKVDRNSL